MEGTILPVTELAIKRILALPAGYELDSLVSKLMGDRREADGWWISGDGDQGPSGKDGEPPWDYSASITEAWRVVEKTGLFKTAVIFQHDDGTWEIQAYEDRCWGDTVEAETAPLVICRAALYFSLSKPSPISGG